MKEDYIGGIKRTAIFVIYNENGRLTRDVEYLITDLKKCVWKFVVVINGCLVDYDKVERLSDYMIVRKNLGFDAGAYKQAIMDAKVSSFLGQSDEIVFCNDTFYGPFLHFNDIFDKMNKSKVDFWGINYSGSGYDTFIQSYFLVFRKRIIQSGNLFDFFNDNIDGDTDDFMKVLMSFERGIFYYLVKKGYVYGALNTQVYHILDAYDGSVCYDKLPILKKKAFTDKYYDKDKMMNALRYIHDNYEYDISLILEDVKDRYGIDLSREEIMAHEINIHSDMILSTKVKRFDVESFIDKFKGIYIYGTGKCAKNVTEIIGCNHIEAYIVTRRSENDDYFCGKPVYEISDFQDNNIPIIIALNKENTEQVKEYLEGFKNKLFWN
jgi:rhamnosyltransferase